MLGLGTGEMVMIGLVVLLLFGGKNLPKLGQGLAHGIKNFQKGIAGQEENDTTKNS